MVDSNKLSRFVLEELQANHIDKELAVSLIKKINEREDIAIIGMGCKVADAENYEEYWNLIANTKVTVKRCASRRIDLIRKAFPRFLTNSELKYSKGTYFEDVDMFYADFFSMDENEAAERLEYIPSEPPKLDKGAIDSDIRGALNALKAVRDVARFFDENDSNCYAMVNLFSECNFEQCSRYEKEFMEFVFHKLGIKKRGSI